MNKKIIVAISLCLLASLAGLVITTIDDSAEWGYQMIRVGLGAGQLLGLMMMISNGTIMGTLSWKIIVGLLALILFGAILKIMHYAYADESLLVGCLGVATTYLVRFMAKKEKHHLDFLKLVWVLTAYIGGLLIAFHITSSSFRYVIMGTFWLLLLDFVWLEFKTPASR